MSGEVRPCPMNEPASIMWPLGIDDEGHVVEVRLPVISIHKLLAGGEPGTGKSWPLSLLAAVTQDPGSASRSGRRRP